jgi:2',3'-cyclic-nucleotide 2'-phosphodiesterase (5'-nucleotidase family)
MGYSVMVPGNHDFDYNLETGQPLYYSDCLLKAVSFNNQHFISALAVNLSYQKKTLPLVSQNPLILWEGLLGGQKRRLIVVGVITPYVLRPSLAQGLIGFDFGLLEGIDSAYLTRESLLEKLTCLLAPYQEPGDVVIVLAHMGVKETKEKDRISGLDLALIPGVDFIIDGHSHEIVEPQNLGNTVYLNCGQGLTALAEITLIAENVTKVNLLKYNDLIEINPDPVLEGTLSNLASNLGLKDFLFKLKNQYLFTCQNLMTNNIPLGRLICRSMLEITDSDLAMINPGAIREGLGESVYSGDIFECLPFGDELYSFLVSGKELQLLFEAFVLRGLKGLPQFFGFSIFGYLEGLEGLKILEIMENKGKKLNSEKSYRLAISGQLRRILEYHWPDRVLLDPKNYGDLATVVAKNLKGISEHSLEELLVNNTLKIFDSRNKAEEAFINRQQ